MLIIGITGTIGSGKGTVVEYLVEQFHYAHFSVRKYLTDVLISQGIEPNRDNFTLLANRLREENNSPSYIIEQLYLLALKNGQNAIIESIRTPGEVEKLRELGPFYLLAVDADRAIRYERIYARNSETDNIGFEKFVSDEEREMQSTNPNNQNISACIELADFKLENNGDISNLKTQIDQILETIHSRISNG